MPARLRKVKRVAALSAGAFVLYGAWAAWANHEHGASWAVRAFFVQGASSATTTALIGGVVEVIRARLGVGRASTVAAAFLGACGASAFHLVVHLIVGTPEILRTIAPSVVMAFVFAG